MKIPEPWIDALNRLRKIDADAHIAGGALRDVSLGREPKDLDIFVPATVGRGRIVKLLGEPLMDRGYEQYGNLGDTVGQMLFNIPGMPPVNVILTEKYPRLWQNMARFDFGICRIGYGTMLVTTDEFMEDEAAREFVLRRCRSAEDYWLSMNRWERFRARFPGWSLRVLPEFQHYGGELARVRETEKEPFG